MLSRGGNLSSNGRVWLTRGRTHLARSQTTPSGVDQTRRPRSDGDEDLLNKIDSRPMAGTHDV